MQTDTQIHTYTQTNLLRKNGEKQSYENQKQQICVLAFRGELLSLNHYSSKSYTLGNARATYDSLEEPPEPKATKSNSGLYSG